MTHTTYPVSNSMTINFSALEDRLIVSAPRVQAGAVQMLLTRRMTMLVLKQLLERLAGLSDLGKTPSEYWQDVLQMAHQQAMQAVQAPADTHNPASSVPGENVSGETPQGERKDDVSTRPIYLATELTTQVQDKQLVLAFRGLPMPDAMTQPRPHEPVLAIPLQLDNVHQLIELLINRARDAQWHLPVDLPWLAAPDVSATPAHRAN